MILNDFDALESSFFEQSSKGMFFGQKSSFSSKIPNSSATLSAMAKADAKAISSTITSAAVSIAKSNNSSNIVFSSSKNYLINTYSKHNLLAK